MGISASSGLGEDPEIRVFGDDSGYHGVTYIEPPVPLGSSTPVVNSGMSLEDQERILFTLPDGDSY